MSRAVTRMTIDDAEHFTEEERAEIIASYPPHEREARVKGIPALGSGRVYPIAEEVIRTEPIQTPDWWWYIAGIDFGWEHPTAAVKLAHDRDADVIYVTHCYRRKEATPLEHAASLRPWGDQPWAWPADAYQRDKRSGGTLKEDYAASGLKMLNSHATHPDGGVGLEAGVMDILTRMQSGRFKVFSHLTEWFEEFRLYHRKNGIIVDKRDDLMDATRYAMMMRRYALPNWEDEEYEEARGRSEATGY